MMLSLHASSQLKKDKYYIKHFSLESGISQCVITDMVQDKKGFIWLGTYDGLNRFDGYEFKIFRSIPGDTNSLPSSKVLKMFYDDDTHIWLTANKVMTIFNIETGKVEHASALQNKKFLHVCHANNNEIWAFAKDKKLYRIHKNSLSIQYESIKNDLLANNEELLQIIHTPKNIICISKLGHIYTYHIPTNRWSKSYNFVGKTNTTYTTTAYDFRSTIFIGSLEADLLEYDIVSKTFSASIANTLNIQLLGINDMVYSKKNNALIITTYGQGLFYYDITKQNVFQYKTGDANFALASNYPNCVIQDQYGTIWIGYDGKGLDILDPNIKKFISLRKDSSVEKFNLHFVRNIVEDKKGILWFATSGSGLISYSRASHTFKFYNEGSLIPTAKTFIIEMELVDNLLWLGLNGGGITIFDIEKKKVVKKIESGEEANKISSGFVWSFLYDKQANQMWVGTADKGINKIDLNTHKVKQYFALNNPIYQDNGMRSMFKTKDNNFLVGSENGLLLFNRSADIFERVFPTLEERTDNIHSIKCLHEDYKGRLWLGTDGTGIVVLNKNFKLLRHFSTNNFLINNVVYGILPENTKSFWISHNNGLSNIVWDERVFKNNKALTVYNYDAKTGLQSNEFNTNSYLKLKDGSLAFGGINGVNIFRGENVRPSKTSPHVAITDFAVFNKNMNKRQLTPYINSVDLAYNQNSFSLKYNTVGFTLPEKIKYRYRLLGYDDHWVEAGKRTYVSFTNLTPGEYEFQILASNYDGYWGTNSTSIKINIRAPFYKQWWFIIGSILLLSLLIFIIVRERIVERNNRQALNILHNKELAEVEMKALRAQINPHFLFNSLNSINNFILKNDNNNARKYLVKFSQLVRNILNNSTTPYVSLKEELDTIQLYVQIESMRFDNQFNFNLIVPKDMNTAEVNIPSLLLQPYIENAIWHGLLHKMGSKNIEIRISRKNEQLIQIEIEDNGIGRRAAANLASNENKRKSYGMQLGENRLKLMNSANQQQGEVEVIDLFDIHGCGRGTLIIITLPIIAKTASQETALSLN